MEPGCNSIVDELKQIRETLLKQIDEVEHGTDAEKYSREIRTSKAALKSINQLLADGHPRAH